MGWQTPAAASRAGIYAALASVSMLFASLTLFFLERRGLGGAWYCTPLPQVLYFNTLLLLTSSGTLELARRALSADRLRAFQGWIYGTLGLGLAFLAGQWMAWRQLAAAGVYLKGNPSSAFFYFATGAHALHLAGGLAALVYLALKARELRWGLRRRTVVDVTSIYWHFMDGLWVYLLAVLLAMHA
ncbi:MAG TPA: cytochrome c oxidase subunit 3 [Terriglobia bacterium]|nr:cytochrome c oxidase subunit 3 [Terriglobia bacterium]